MKRPLQCVMWGVCICFLLLSTRHSALATQLPSLFRGVVVADSPVGVRVVSVEDGSQADLADLRAEDIIVSVDGKEIHSIDEFAILSSTGTGRLVRATVLVFRNGIPHELSVHLYSYPILRTWGVEFIPNLDVRFAQAQVGLEYWMRLGRGFEEAHKPVEALDAYLNGLHNVPTALAVALKVSELYTHVSQEHLSRGDLVEGIAALRQAVLLTEKLFDYPLTEEQLQAIKHRLTQTLEVLRQTTHGKKGIKTHVTK